MIIDWSCYPCGAFCKRRRRQDARRSIGGRLFLLANLASLPIQIAFMKRNRNKLVARVKNDKLYKKQLINEMKLIRKDIKRLEAKPVLSRDEKVWLLQSRQAYREKKSILEQAGIRFW